MQVLASTLHLPQLELLGVGMFFSDLDSNGITSKGLISMPDCTLQRLKTLWLGTSDGNNIGSKGALLLVRADLPLLE